MVSSARRQGLSGDKGSARRRQRSLARARITAMTINTVSAMEEGHLWESQGSEPLQRWPFAARLPSARCTLHLERPRS